MTLALVTGASSGIGYELARFAAEDGHRLVIAADEDAIEHAAGKLRRLGATVETVQADLATPEGVETLWRAVEGQDIDLFFANAGRALGHAFIDQDPTEVLRLIRLNVVQTTVMLRRVGAKMQARGSGRILVTGSIAGFAPGPFDAVYNATKAYLDSLAYALRDEWRDGPVTLTCLMPGMTATRLFTREGNRLSDTPAAEVAAGLDNVTEVARAGYEAMMAGEPGVVPGFGNRLAAMLAGIVPQSVLAEINRRAFEPEGKPR